MKLKLKNSDLMEVGEFKIYCKDFEPDVVVQKFIIEGSSYYFSEVISEDEYDFKRYIANELDVHIRDVIIVGSGKLGFSLKPDNSTPETGLYRFKKFDYDFELDNSNKKSDLDIAVVSSRLFDLQLEQLFNHTKSYQHFSGKERNDFAKYVLKGRFVLKFLPKDFRLSEDISIVQSTLKMRYGREVNLEIYKSWFFFESYHKNNILNIQLNLIA